ncbi:hypothetical protein AC622_08575 [Bacillus sp. FJAT-27916]|uniref:phosphoribosylanthranilate isomerase n=1 Tax=Bacillus sp. FJAT-27916 TaxID=1679169 RepID=UPI0006A0FF31|nr:phosphoribosylanthranilate isomerase [Bacillus sp. FJAT-27916]KMY44300.1 hypothetical protein AC622_08575 [Bacillus sp. FJAT-27916]
MMNVKICGIQTGEDAQTAVRLGADALGFVFADSKRRITPADVRAITENVPKECLKVGVFVNEHPLMVNEIAGFCGLDAIQLHGDEYTADYEIIGLPIIRSIPVIAGENVFLQKYGKADYYLLDTGGGKARGGMGIAFDWRQVRGIGLGDDKVILAGGLNAANVGDAMQIVHPYMVDVSSGVETGGAKNPALMKAFIDAVKREEMV